MDMAGPTEADLRALLDFHVAAGVDLALDEAPHDRFAESAEDAARRQAARRDALPTRDRPREAPPREAGRPDAPRGFDVPPSPVPAPELPSAADAPTTDVAAHARARAASAATLDELKAILAGFDGCTLKASARQLVFSSGTPGARLMLLGEAPGADEDRSGEAFVGRAGQLLDRMLAAIGLDRTGAYIANAVPWRPPGNRTPTPQEVAICLPFTLRQIELCRPEILVTLGAPATQTILGISEGITKARGRWHEHRVGGHALRVLPMLHPAYLLRAPLQKRLAWRDLQALKRALDPPKELG